MKVYRNHRCTAHHRSPETFLRCAIRHVEWIRGRGEYALIAWCGAPTITLWQRVQDADEAQKAIDVFGCGGRCQRRHEVVAIEWDTDRSEVRRG